MSFPTPHKILSAASFRLTVTYAALFVAGTLTLLFACGFVAIWWLTGELEDEVRDEVEVLEALYRDEGLSALQEEIDARAQESLESGLFYGLTSGALDDEERAHLAGNLTLLDFRPGWFEFLPPGEEDEDEFSRAQAVQLAEALWLVVGVDMDPVDDTWELMLGGTGWTLGISLPLALICGAIMSAMVLRRIEIINATTLKIRDGGMTSRVPVEGSGDEFDRLCAHINAMLDSIETLTRNIQQVSVGIAHDLRTPLSRVHNRLEALKAAPPEMAPQSRERLEEAVEGALEEVSALLETFDALLRIGQIEAGTRRAGFEPLDLSALLAELAETYEVMAGENNKTLTAEIIEDCRIRGDRALLVQMVANVVENAIEHTPDQARIRVKLARTDGGASLSVWDSGPGIPEDEHENVFKRFYRLNEARNTRGNGLGLSIVRSIANLHDVTIRMRNLQSGFNIEFDIPTEARP